MQIALLNGPELRQVLAELIPLAEKRGIWIRVAWAKDHPIRQLLLDHAANIHQITVGNSFNATSPDVVEEWLANGLLVLAGQSPHGVYHPKTYQLQGQGWRALIVGSSNLTFGGLGLASGHEKNTESNLLYFSGHAKHRTMPVTSRFLDQGAFSMMTMNDNAANSDFFDQVMTTFQTESTHLQRIDSRWLKAYTRDYKKTESIRQSRYADEVKQARQATMAFFDASKRLHQLSWRDYFRRLTHHPELEQRLDILRLTDARWKDAHHQFSAIPEAQRLEIAGLTPEANQGAMRLDWRLFGNMSRNSHAYRHKVLNEAQDWDAPLATCRDSHTQDETDLLLVWAAIQRKGIQTGRITRMLALTRPDLYVPVTGKNKSGLATALGTALPQKIDHASSYWHHVLEPLRRSPWWGQPLDTLSDPLEIQIWHVRMALVDMLVYEP